MEGDTFSPPPSREHISPGLIPHPTRWRSRPSARCSAGVACLARLTPGSGRVMRGALNALADVLTAGRCDAPTLDWQALRCSGGPPDRRRDVQVSLALTLWHRRGRHGRASPNSDMTSPHSVVTSPRWMMSSRCSVVTSPCSVRTGRRSRPQSGHGRSLPGIARGRRGSRR